MELIIIRIFSFLFKADKVEGILLPWMLFFCWAWMDKDLRIGTYINRSKVLSDIISRLWSFTFLKIVQIPIPLSSSTSFITSRRKKLRCFQGENKLMPMRKIGRKCKNENEGRMSPKTSNAINHRDCQCKWLHQIECRQKCQKSRCEEQAINILMTSSGSKKAVK